mmetsp:Transcript_2662/g.3866  ORF Transcript_2662/g.3866 Transcript_2662/m.3866 type:complete len:155 (-) Transcript_2662:830-1294(-)|eukprot:CAMPEP_0201550284 /NCGR_PEP_ID=MMETSP0173_2-20130828/6667_1 /ASSEMBLY_ACC=CAM_ASM_000268 /TAXON_ID=218659 /ORGANISM="Vexillifera sp., Strain DIVA3 564/2" /LENGTH=154 /DNA_ID=CAMNT_0047960215 /DNA_START=706 /DNA_END=1170 /DNA_ORIENTATION=-
MVTKKGQEIAAKKKQQRANALKYVKALQAGQTLKRAKWRTSVQFRRPKTLELPRRPKYPRRAVPRQPQLDAHRVIQFPLTTETAMRKIEENNTLVFIVDVRANKFQIRAAVAKLYDIKPRKVNTLIRPDGSKKAFIRLGSEYDALDVANKIGII